MVGLALLAVIPIAIVFLGMLVFHKPAMILGPLGLVVGTLLAMFVFHGAPDRIQFAFTDGGLESLRVIFMLWAAFTILDTVKGSGAMEVIKDAIKKVTRDKRILLVIIAMGFGSFLEGAAGSGSPAAVAAPMLIGLGYQPIVAATAALICNSFIVCWGAAGATLNFGASVVKGIITSEEINFWLGRAVPVLGFTLPFILIWAVFGRKGLRGLIPNLLVAGLSFGAAVMFASTFLGPEVVGMTTGLVTMIMVGVSARWFTKSVPEEYLLAGSNVDLSRINMPLWRAMSPYLLVLIMLPLVRNTVPYKTLTQYGYLTWIAVVLWICCIAGSLLLGVKTGELSCYARRTFRRMIPSFIALGSLLTLARVMRFSGMMEALAVALGTAVGRTYPFAALAIGTLGAYIAGTSATSNLMFNGLHVTAAKHVGLVPLQPVIMQHLGSAIGNMICTHNIVAVAATVGLLGQEGDILRKVLKPFIVVFLTTAVIGYLITLTI
ncbi:L-lactate permease [Gelria sp. Kuro-4]|uniref:L-lactate permease n=1 Tax=Gelria sp. Kuro-4 TaxID=2796927 RepID=UPI001BEF7BEB|nr:L-lactate permease [Gelria sp. Kuro-4]BCV25241.1 L-lactate permease [Gelria sp. Kuro-4]